MTQETSKSVSPSPLKSFGRDLTTGSIPRHLILFSLPMLAGSVFQNAYAFINAIWVGQFLGKTSLAAVTVSFPIFFFITAIAGGLTLATNILISQHYGARDLAAVRRVVHSSTLLVGAISLILMIAGEVLTPYILGAMNTPPDALPLSIGYMRIVLLSMPLGFGLFLSRSMLQGVGDSTTPLYFQSAAVILNALLDPVLMFGWLGLPPMGLNGAAWATVISQAMALGALAIYLRRRGSLVAFSLGADSLDGHTAWTTVYVGMPTAIQQSLISVSMMFIVGIINSFGETATAGWGAGMRIDQWAFLPAMTFSMAISTLAGQNIGAGQQDRIRQVFLWGCILSGGVTLVLSVIIVSIPHALVHIFTGDEPVVEAGAQYLRIVGSCYIFFAIMFVSNGIINGSGHTMVITIISLVSQWAFRVPLAWWLSRRLGSVAGVWYAVGASFALSMLASLGYYLSGGWRKAAVRRRSDIQRPVPAPTEE